MTRQSNSRRGVAMFELFLGVLVAGFVGFVTLVMFIGYSRGAGEPAARSQCRSNLKQLSLALWNYADTYGEFPPAVVTDADGTPLHSWRVLVLPFLDEPEVEKLVNLSQPWDAPTNAAARLRCPAVFRCPSADLANDQTTYLAMLAPGSVMGRGQSETVAEVEASKTGGRLLLVDAPASEAVHWMQPTDTDLTLFDRLADDLSHRGYLQFSMADATSRGLPLEEVSTIGPRLIDGSMTDKF